ncbi:hypothetical protein Q7P37_003765 [Cladosporium fusiforme]
MPSHKPSLPKRLRDLAMEKLSRISKLIRLHQLEQNETKNLRAEELAMSPPGSAPLATSTPKAREVEGKRCSQMFENKPLPLLPDGRLPMNGVAPTVNREGRLQQRIDSEAPFGQIINHEQKALGFDDEQPSRQSTTEFPVGLGISMNEPTTRSFNNLQQPLANPATSPHASIAKPPNRTARLIDWPSNPDDYSVALLLTPNLQDNITQILLAQRKVHTTSHALTKTFDHASKAKLEISHLSDKLSKLRAKIAGIQRFDRDAARERVAELETALDNANSLLANTTAHRERLFATLREQSRELKGQQTHLNVQLDEAFTNAFLLSPLSVGESNPPAPAMEEVGIQADATLFVPHTFQSQPSRFPKEDIIQATVEILHSPPIAHHNNRETTDNPPPQHYRHPHTRSKSSPPTPFFRQQGADDDEDDDEHEQEILEKPGRAAATTVAGDFSPTIAQAYEPAKLYLKTVRDTIHALG